MNGYLIESNPIAAWCGGKGTGGRAYFEYNGSELSTDINVPAGACEDFQNLVRELVDWRLAEYLGRGESGQEWGALSAAYSIPVDVPS